MGCSPFGAAALRPGLEATWAVGGSLSSQMPTSKPRPLRLWLSRSGPHVGTGQNLETRRECLEEGVGQLPQQPPPGSEGARRNGTSCRPHLNWQAFRSVPISVLRAWGWGAALLRSPSLLKGPCVQRAV
uniref:Uncharacterized protein n=1 Tax=Rousettus aegyptiacus TaxID=9407 RepID=A0A7J8BFA3_ROUAE|nr:hypothetical protein HJG63_009789 [Rousettus aegyptiacus]